MFKELSEKMIAGESATVVITKVENGLAVSVRINSAEKTFLPIQITGTAPEMDDNFAEALSVPLQKIKPTFTVNTEEFDKSVTEESKPATVKKSRSATTEKAKPEAPKDPLIEARSLMAESRWEEARKDLEAIIPKLKGTEKKEAESLLYDAKVEIQKKLSGFDVDEKDEIPLPGKLKEIAKNSPNVIVGTVKTLAEEVLPELSEDEFESDLPEEEEEESEYNPDDDF